jgi:hypothetical protein
MSAQEFCQVVRKPRHQATGDAELRVWLERSDADPAFAAEAQLVDVSRNGLQVQVNSLFATGEAIVVRIVSEQAGLDLSLPGTVQWQRAAENGAWSVGCLFPEPLAWEIIGELFLNQVLATEAPAR